MPTHIVHFLHSSEVTGSQVLGTAFSLADVHAHDLQASLPPFQKDSRNFKGILGGLHVFLTSAASPTTVTMRICADAAGDYPLIPDTTATLVAGVTTATQKSAAFSIDLPAFQFLTGPGNGTLYVFAYVDDGTGNPVLARTILTWKE